MSAPSDRRPRIGLLAAWALSFGCTIGWGAFVMPGVTFLPGAGPLGTAIGVAVAGLAMVAVAFNYRAMSVRMPGPGGAFTFANDAFGGDHGFLASWFLCLAYAALVWANATAIPIVARYALGDVFEFGFRYKLAGYDICFGEAAISCGAIAAACGACLLGRRFAARTQTFLAVAFAAGAAACFAAALAGHSGGLETAGPAFAADGASPARQIVRIVALAPWLFIGFETVSHSSAELGFPVKRLFGAMCAAIAAAAFVYIAMALLPALATPGGHSSWASYLAAGKSAGNAAPVFAAARKAVGAAGTAALAATMLGALLTSIVGNMFAAGRLLAAMADSGILPASFGTRTRDGSPRGAVLFIGAVSMAMPFLGRTAIGWHVDVSTIGAAIAYGYTSAAAWKFARAEGRAGGRAAGAAGVALSIVFCILPLLPDSESGSTFAAESYLVLVVWSILGFLYFLHVFKKDDGRNRFGDTTVVWGTTMMLVFLMSQLWMRETARGAIRTAAANISSFPASGEAAKENLDRQLDAVERKFGHGNMIQTGLMAMALFIIASVYSVLRRREKRLESERASAEERSRAKTAFLSNMSHDIRTPMNAIAGYAELASREGTTREELAGYIAKIDAAGRHLLGLINDILEMSRIEAGKMSLHPERTDLAAVVSAARDMFAPQMAAKNVAFETDASGIRDRSVFCDAPRLDRVITNLLGNACKFTPSGGRVSFVLSQGPDEKSGFASYVFRVEDTGIGMSPAFASRVFDAFERERTSTVSGIQGTGLGMAITKSIVTLMGGEIGVETEQGKGTVFTVRLSFPVAPEAAPERARPAPAARRSFDGMRILLAEDNEINREIAEKMLGGAGFETDAAVNGKEALDMFAASEPGRYDAVLMDVQMPVMDGYSAARAIRALDRPDADVPIVALSANAFASDVRDALAAGMDAHVAKPFKMATLAETLADVLAKKKKRSEP